MEVRTRIAPSPTGFLHIGNVYTALFNYVLAKKMGGKFILRIEDTDRKRLVKGAQEVIVKGLKWFGLEFEGPYIQSERLEIYREQAELLVDKGVAYRKDGAIWLKVPKDQEISFVDEVRGKITINSNEVNDQVLLKSNGYPTYHLAVVVDDHLMRITHVMRAEEWLSSVPKHVLIYQGLGWPLPKFIHLPLLRNADRSKISKRKNPVSVEWYQEQGFLPEAILNYLSLLGWSHPKGKEIFDLKELIEKFTVKRLAARGPVFDLRKLEWMNGKYIRQLSVDELVKKLEKYSRFAKKDNFRKVIGLLQERVVKLKEFDELAEYFWHPPKARKLAFRRAGEIMMSAAIQLIEEGEFEAGRLENDFRKLLKEKDWQAKEFFGMLRDGLTGREVSPPLFTMMEVMGKELVIKRLKKSGF